MERLWNKDCDPKQLSPLTLAFLGDCVFELLVREALVCQANRPVQALHQSSVAQVCCQAQAQSLEKILPLFTEEELAIYKRGRNAKVTPPKSASTSDYHKATGLEAVFGYLYLKSEFSRLQELYRIIVDAQSDPS